MARRSVRLPKNITTIEDAMNHMGIGANDLDFEMICRHLEGIDLMIANPDRASDEVRAGAYRVLTQLTSVLIQRTALSKRHYVATAPIAVNFFDDPTPETAAYIREMLPKVRRDVAGYLEQFFSQAPAGVREAAMEMIPQPKD